MNDSSAEWRFSTTSSNLVFPLCMIAFILCVFCPSSIQADDAANATSPTTTKLSLEEPSKTNDTTDPSTEVGVIRINFQGSFEVSIAGVGVVRGEGTTAVELDGPEVVRLFHDFEARFGESKLRRRDIVDTVISLPSTIRSTNETLRMLSDPETQEALRRVESLLRLLPKIPVPSELQTDADSEKE